MSRRSTGHSPAARVSANRKSRDLAPRAKRNGRDQNGLCRSIARPPQRVKLPAEGEARFPRNLPLPRACAYTAVERRRAARPEGTSIDDPGCRYADSVVAVVAAPADIERERLPRVEERLIEGESDGDALGKLVVAAIEAIDLRLQAIRGVIEASDGALQGRDLYCLGIVCRRVLIDLDLLI